jgi:hypothetical protein
MEKKRYQQVVALWDENSLFNQHNFDASLQQVCNNLSTFKPGLHMVVMVVK